MRPHPSSRRTRSLRGGLRRPCRAVRPPAFRSQCPRCARSRFRRGRGRWRWRRSGFAQFPSCDGSISKLSRVKPPEDPLTSLGSNLACALLAQLLNVMLAAVLAAQVPGGYRVRSWVFLAAVLWSLGGTVLLLVGTTRGVARNGAPGSHQERARCNQHSRAIVCRGPRGAF